MLLRSMRLSAFVFLLFVIVAPAVKALEISAPFTTVGVGDTFTVAISIADATELQSWQFDLAFNAVLLQANSVTEGAFLSSNGTQQTLFSPGFIDNTTGVISLVTDSYVDFSTPPSGSGDLVDISFTALAGGISPLTLSNVFLNWSDLGFDIVNGQVRVNGTAPVPEPATLTLLFSGLALFGVRSKFRGARRKE
jgi:hypothetical protein